jgi:imidazole glycerol-phosphate synthase subunit HisF
MYHRIIAKLDIKGPNLVKGIHLEGLRVLGKPEEFSKYYYNQGVDELLYMDVVASLYNRNSIHDLISRTAENIFIPLTVGGGLRTLDDIRSVLRAGADKVSLNTAAVKNPDLIKQAAHYFGSSTIVVTIEAIKQPNGMYEAFVDNGREHTGKEVVAWAKEVAHLGAGEIVITSVDQEGTGKGYDLELTRSVADAVDIPVIASGGAGSVQDVKKAFTQGHADAVTVSSVLHYGYIHQGKDMGHHEQEGNIEFLKKRRAYGNIMPISIPGLKSHLIENDILCRS